MKVLYIYINRGKNCSSNVNNYVFSFLTTGVLVCCRRHSCKLIGRHSRNSQSSSWRKTSSNITSLTLCWTVSSNCRSKRRHLKQDVELAVVYVYMTRSSCTPDMTCSRFILFTYHLISSSAKWYSLQKRKLTSLKFRARCAKTCTILRDLRFRS